MKEFEKKKKYYWPFVLELVAPTGFTFVWYCACTGNASLNYIGLLTICVTLIALPTGIVGLLQVLKTKKQLFCPMLTIILSCMNVAGGMILLVINAIIIYMA